jgi:diguanylate cyclase (GGDEF)-like protein
MDVLFSNYQSSLRWGIERFLAEGGVQAAYFSVGALNASNADNLARERMFELIDPTEYDGVLLCSSSLLNGGGLERLRDRLKPFAGLPTVSIGPAVGDEDAVAIDGRPGLRNLLVHLIEDHGYRDLAFVSGPNANPDAGWRLDVYRRCLADFAIAAGPERIFEGDFRQSSGIEAVHAFYDLRGLKPQAIVCASDFMAIGAWKALRARGLSVPQDVAVTGFDDMQISHLISHQFTTVRQPFAEQAYRAARRLVAKIVGREAGPLLELPADLLVRTSCGCLEPARRQRRGEPKNCDERLDALARRLELHAAAGLTEAEARVLCRDWMKLVHLALDEKRPVFELEGMLDVLRRLFGPETDPRVTALLAVFHTLFLEEFGQAQMLASVFDAAMMTGLRIALTRLQEALIQNDDESLLPELLDDIAKHSQSGEFAVVLFDDPRRPAAGARVVYDRGGAVWRPGPGAWLPRGDGGIAVNVLASGPEAIGYLAMSSDIENIGVYDYVATNLARLFQDRRVMREMRELNARLLAESAARAASQRALVEALAQVERLSVEDELTKLRNRRGFLDFAEQQIKLLRRQVKPFILLYADLDGLKGINDGYGHKEGDLAIRSAARALTGALRETDVIARLGGDEFAALIVDAGAENAGVIGDRIQAAVAKLDKDLNRPWRLSLSVGFHFAAADGEQELGWMMEQADAELYRQKQLRKSARG